MTSQVNTNSATPQLTADYFKNHASNQTQIRLLDGVNVSTLGVGTYLGDSTAEVDRQCEDALVTAARSGINFFDTAINYRCQRSERNIAFALRKLAGLGIERGQIIVATKGGFLPADGSAENFKNYILKTFISTGVMTPDDIVANCHCMTPKFLQAQIDLSLSNLKLKSVDLYYLHNPEIQLPVLGEDVFYRRLRAVFELFERNVSDGKMARYGVATWDGFRQPFGQSNRLDLPKVLQCAEDVAGRNHHLKAIQVPYNLAMLEAVAIQNQTVESETFPIFPAAVKAGLAVFVSAPLCQGNIQKLPQRIFDAIPGRGNSVQKALQFVVSSPGVVSAMVGMKSIDHVHENVKVLSEDALNVQDLQNIARMLVRSS